MTTRLLDATDHAAELTPYLRFWVFGWRNGSVLPVGVEEKFCDLIPPLLEKKYLKTIYNCHSCRVMIGCVEVLPPWQATGLNKSSRGDGRAKHLS